MINRVNGETFSRTTAVTTTIIRNNYLEICVRVFGSYQIGKRDFTKGLKETDNTTKGTTKPRRPLTLRRQNNLITPKKNVALSTLTTTHATSLKYFYLKPLQHQLSIQPMSELNKHIYIARFKVILMTQCIYVKRMCIRHAASKWAFNNKIIYVTHLGNLKFPNM